MVRRSLNFGVFEIEFAFWNFLRLVSIAACKFILFVLASRVYHSFKRFCQVGAMEGLVVLCKI